ncbi:MAG: DUF2203 domain-containing protein [Chloroflexi bacterium]|nr:DUF2203 domain-containing protein [Chloroflexota bacterium]
MTKIFTLAEANALLPRIRIIVEGLQAIRQEAMVLRPEVWPVLEKAVGNGGSRKAGELLELFKRFEKWLTELQGYGCELKGLEQGLIDFPAIMQGRQVYLCWQYDEPEIAFWHDIDAGFAGRQPL